MLGRFGRLGLVVLALAVVGAARNVPAQGADGQGQAAQNAVSGCPDAGGLFAAYDVVSVRPVNAMPRFVGLQEQPDGISGETVPVNLLVQEAYSTERALPAHDALDKLPDWAKMPTYYSVQAKLSAEQAAALAKLDKDQQKACRTQMLRALLADRFKLQVHHETRQMLSYELVVAPGGSKMKEVSASDPGVVVGSGGRLLIKNNLSYIDQSTGEEVVQNFPIDSLAAMLMSSVDHRVVNKTGLTGLYSYTLKYAASRGVGPAGGPAEPVASDPGPTVFQALEEQLGLKLQRGVDAVDVVVVDHIERPSEN